MGTQLIFTVGTNPLPIWVAWHHLKDKLQPVQVRFVHTAGTKKEKERLKNYCHGADFLNPIETSAGKPDTVRRDITNIMNSDDLRATSCLHVHYTGGTKVMGVETVAAIEASLPKDIQLDTSYLDARADSGPTIVDQEGIMVGDTREGIAPNLNQIALLNGFTIGPFTSEYWSWGSYCLEKEECPAPRQPTPEELNWGMVALHSGRCKDPIHIEYGAYAAFQNALGQIPNRTNYQLFHSVYARRPGNRRNRHFELDVVAVLGYQIVVVSCTVDHDPKLIKHKGMEAITRARQLGGDEARAIVLCGAQQRDTGFIEAELQDETGSSDLPLQVWGRNTWKNLSQQFYRYLRNDLHWR